MERDAHPELEEVVTALRDGVAALTLITVLRET
jgi:hypothetical protein